MENYYDPEEEFIMRRLVRMKRKNEITEQMKGITEADVMKMIFEQVAYETAIKEQDMCYQDTVSMVDAIFDEPVECQERNFSDSVDSHCREVEESSKDLEKLYVETCKKLRQTKIRLDTAREQLYSSFEKANRKFEADILRMKEADRKSD